MSQSSMDGVFRVNAVRKAKAPEDLDRLSPLVPPRGFLILGVVLATTVAALGWGIFGSVPVTMQATGVVTSDSQAIVFVPFLDAKKTGPGTLVRLSGPARGSAVVESTGHVAEVADYPPSRAEIGTLLGNEVLADWFTAHGPVVWARVRLDGGSRLAAGTPLQARFILSERRPITLLWGRR